MKTLTFKNGKAFDFLDSSTINTLVFYAAAFSDLDAIKTEFEKADNLIGGIFDRVPISETVYTGAQVELAADGAIIARFTTRAYTNEEIVNQRLSDLEDTVAELI